MLVLRRTEGQWVDIKHEKTGELIRVRVHRIDWRARQLDLVFDDDARNFDIQRPERKLEKEAKRLAESQADGFAEAIAV